MFAQRSKQRKAAMEAKAPKAKVKTAKVKTTKKVKTKARSIVKGTLRLIAKQRRYKEHEAVMNEDGTPLAKSIFDARGRYAQAISEENVNKGRVVPISALYRHLNETVFLPVFGTYLREDTIRMLLDGISAEVLVLVENGWKIKFQNLVTMFVKERAARMARNPRTGDAVPVPAHTVMAVKAHAATKTYLAHK